MNNRLKEARLKLKLSQKRFGRLIFLSQDQISLLENGKRNLTNRTINAICTKFNISEDWLRNGTGNMFNNLIYNKYKLDTAHELAEKIFSLDQENRQIIEDLIYK